MDHTRSSSSTDCDEERQFLYSDKDNTAQWPSIHLATGSNTTKAFTWTRVYVFTLHVALILTGTFLWISSQKDSGVIPLAGRSWCT